MLKKEDEEKDEDDEEIPEKFKGKPLKEIVRSYKEAEKEMHKARAESIKFQTLLDLVPKPEGGKPVAEPEKNNPPKEPATAGLEIPENLKPVLLEYGRRIYEAAVNDSIAYNNLKDGVSQYIDKYPHLRKAGKLFNAEVMGLIQQKPSATLYEVFEEARKTVEDAVGSAGGKKETGKSRTLEGGASPESRLTEKRKEQEAEEEENTEQTLSDYIAERQKKRNPPSH